MAEIIEWRNKIREEVSKVFLGKPEHVDFLLAALLSEGHVLLEDIPGVGKTLLAKALAICLGGEFQRIQCTPDLMPSDILGFSIYNPKSGEFDFHKGPVQTHILLVDEINRASPRSQAALLQAMGEGEISRDGSSIALPDPFFVIATENPVEFEGTFPLPEAQKDRFLLSFSLGYPSREQEVRILSELPFGRLGLDSVRQVSKLDVIPKIRSNIDKVFVDPKVRDYLLDLVQTTREDPAFSLGVSPRGAKVFFRACRALALLRGRNYVLPEEVKDLFIPAVQKRVILKAAAQIRGIPVTEVLEKILGRVSTPAMKEGS